MLELHRRTVREAMRPYPPVAAIVRTVALVLARLTPALRFAPADGPPPEPVLAVTLRPSDGMRLRVRRAS